MNKLKKSPDKERIKSAALAALPQEPAAAAAPDPGPRRRGRPAGLKFPGGYRRPGEAPQAAPTPGAENIHEAATQTAEPVDMGIMRPAIRKLLEAAFNGLLAKKRGEWWHLDQSELDTLAEPVTEIVQELMPDIKNAKWTYRIGVIGMILAPRLMEDMERSGRPIKPAGVKSDAEPKPQPANPAQHSPDPRPTRARQDILVPYDPSKDQA